MKAWQLLDKPEKWTQGPFARDASGRPVLPNSPNAVCWCMLGAIHRCYQPKELTEVFSSIFKQCNREFGVTPGLWNDSKERKLEEVVSLLKELDI